jgi:hypothetical protein
LLTSPPLAVANQPIVPMMVLVSTFSLYILCLCVCVCVCVLYTYKHT